jgi:hypothetical protein
VIDGQASTLGNPSASDALPALVIATRGGEAYDSSSDKSGDPRIWDATDRNASMGG